MAAWMKASDELISLAEEIIAEFHVSLLNTNVGFVFRNEAIISSTGKETWGKASKVPDKIKPYTEDLDFLIWIAMNVWDSVGEETRLALLDHELCHCDWNEEKGAFMRHHDIEEFHEIIERHGFWNHELLKVKEAAAGQQLSFELRRGGRVVKVDPNSIEDNYDKENPES